MTVLSILRRFLRCSFFETIEMRLEVMIALMLMSFRKYLEHLLKISHSYSTVR